jgi:hypothetical protein
VGGFPFFGKEIEPGFKINETVFFFENVDMGVPGKQGRRRDSDGDFSKKRRRHGTNRTPSPQGANWRLSSKREGQKIVIDPGIAIAPDPDDLVLERFKITDTWSGS